MSNYKVIGVNDDKDFCECCGKQGLKSVVWIENTETNEIKHFGSTCAASPVKGFCVDKEIKNAIKSFKNKQVNEWRVAHSLYRKSGGKYDGNGIDGFTANNKELLDKCLMMAKK